MTKLNSSDRILQGQKMIEAWDDLGTNYQHTKQYCFVSDMIVRMKAGRHLSPKQSEWYDSITSAGAPKLQNEDRVKELKEAASVVGLPEFKANVLRDFAYRLGRGWALTEKQENFLQTCLDHSATLKINGPWIPSEEEKAQIILGLNLCKRYTSGYWLAHRPGLHEAIVKTTKWVFDGGFLDVETAKKMMVVCKGDRSKMKAFEKKFPVGTLLQMPVNQLLATIVSLPYVDKNGSIMVDVLMQHKLMPVNMHSLKASTGMKNVA
jgi:hypothetical protein